MEPESHWQATARPVALGHDAGAAVDVVVVGAGLLGASTAYWLARAGARPLLLERKAPAYGATGRNGGFLTVGPAEVYAAAVARLGHATARAIYALTLDNRALVRQVIEEESIDCDYREPGNLSLALGEQQLAEQAQTAAALAADGFSAALLDRAAVQDLVGTRLADVVVGGLYLPDTGLLHSARLAQGLVRAAERHGARTTRAIVSKPSGDDRGVELQTDIGLVRARAAVVAVNAWTRRLIPSLAHVITPVRGQMLSYAPLLPVFRTGMAAALTSTGEYWQQAPDGAIVLGGCRAAAPGKDVGVEEGRPTPAVQRALEEVLPRLCPELRGLRVERRWAGLMAFTPDYVPVADRVPDLGQTWVVGGFCGHGMPFGLRMGQLLAESALSGEAAATLAPFRLNRPALRRP